MSGSDDKAQGEGNQSTCWVGSLEKPRDRQALGLCLTDSEDNLVS